MLATTSNLAVAELATDPAPETLAPAFRTRKAVTDTLAEPVALAPASIICATLKEAKGS
jgi:hypothetical protein